MKRIIFCFDGTWNRLDAAFSTNVVKTAQSILPLSEGITQIVHYDQGVGSEARRWWEKLLEGAFGWGLLDNLEQAYRFLIFNYDPGDQIYVVGFSRGAFSARSFVGLLSYAGLLSRRQAHKSSEAVKLYANRPKEPTDDEILKLTQYRAENCADTCVDDDESSWRSTNVPGYIPGSSPLLEVEYVGVWDTVGALGIPTRFSISHWTNKRYQFHRQELSSLVKSARHAVAIDENRRSFEPTLWNNVDALNRQAGCDPVDESAPYQQQWFPGDHGSIGGGGAGRGLSDRTLSWIVSGAQRRGLDLDTAQGSRILELRPNHQAKLTNAGSVKQPLSAKVKTFVLKVLAFLIRPLPSRLWMSGPRLPGPQSLHEVSRSARRRWLEPAEQLPENVPYRPKTLGRVADALNALDPAEYGIGSAGSAAHIIGSEVGLRSYTIRRGDNLSKIALREYGDAGAVDMLFALNASVLDSKHSVFPGDIIHIPVRPGQATV